MTTRLFLFIIVLLCTLLVLGCEREETEEEPTELDRADAAATLGITLPTATPTSEAQTPCERLGNDVIKRQKEAGYGWYIVKLYRTTPSDPGEYDSTDYALFCEASALLSVGTRGGIDFFEVEDQDGDHLIGYRFQIWSNVEDELREEVGRSLIVKK